MLLLFFYTATYKVMVKFSLYVPTMLALCCMTLFVVPAFVMSAYAVSQLPASTPHGTDFVYNASMPSDLREMLRRDVIQPDAHNSCRNGFMPIWIAPGDMCDMQDMARMEYHPVFQHCNSKYKYNDFAASHHVKACVTFDDVEYLWNSGHCRTNESIPFFRKMHQGLLFCGSNDPCKWKCPSNSYVDYSEYPFQRIKGPCECEEETPAYSEECNECCFINKHTESCMYGNYWLDSALICNEDGCHPRRTCSCIGVYDSECADD
jgi:hypothetical protein